MYKAIQNKKYYLAINTFKNTAKRVATVYHSGFHCWEAEDGDYYSLVIRKFRIIFGIKKPQLATCNGG